MHYLEHSRESQEKIGKPFYVVHRWLDEYAKIYFPSKIHRAHRHHLVGVEEVRQKWGDEAAESAKIHILSDMKDMGFDFIPPDEKWWDDYIAKTY